MFKFNGFFLFSFLTLSIMMTTTLASAQEVLVQGTVIDIETGRKLSESRIRVLIDGQLLSNSNTTGRSGKFELRLPAGAEYTLDINRSGYQPQLFGLVVPTDVADMQVNIPMEALPGYDFEFTLRQLVDASLGKMGDTISGVRVEVYDMTGGKVVQDSILTGSNQEMILERGRRYVFLLRREGYFARRFDVFVDVAGCILCFEGLGSAFEPNILESLKGNGESSGALLADIPMRPIVLGQEFEVENIYYDYDKATIRTDAKSVLDRLAIQLRATPVAIELGSHTDSRGSSEYNQSLSQRRAESAVRYLESRAVAEGRITAQGFGEQNLVNECSDGVQCTEAQHQLNRRTTFKVTKMLQRSTFDGKSLYDLIREEQESKRRSLEILEKVPE